MNNPKNIEQLKDRFDLETEISSLYYFSSQLETINQGILEYDMSKDDIVSAIEGLRVMLELHVQKMEDTLSQCFKLNEYNPAYNSSKSYFPAELPG